MLKNNNKMTTEIQQWLDSEPPPEDIKEVVVNTNIWHIPILTIQGPSKLGNRDYIKGWELLDYKSHVFGYGKTVFFNASGSLKVTFVDGTIIIVPGGATLPVFGKGNTHYEPTIQSEVIKNACKRLGRQFGMFLNKDTLTYDSTYIDNAEETPGAYLTIDEQINAQKDATKK